MALKNRTEVSASIQALTAIVGETEHKESLDDNFAQSVVFRKDVASTDTWNTDTETVDFLDIDYIEATTNAPASIFTITLSNVQQGEIKWLKVNKQTTQIIEFSGATDTTPDSNAQVGEIDVLFKIVNKDGTLYAILESGMIKSASTSVEGIQENATSTEAQAFSATDKTITASNLADVRASSSETTGGTETNRFVSPSTLQDIESATSLSLQNSFTGSVTVRKDNVGNNHLYVNVSNPGNLTSNTTIATLPADNYPANGIPYAITLNSGNQHRISIEGVAGTIRLDVIPDNYTAGETIQLYAVYR